MPMSPVPQSLSPDEFAQLRRFLLEANYTEDGLQEAIGTTIPPHEIFRNMPRLLHLTRRLDPLCVLIRLFFLGVYLVLYSCQKTNTSKRYYCKSVKYVTSIEVVNGVIRP